jgi:hypothetical protein
MAAFDRFSTGSVVLGLPRELDRHWPRVKTWSLRLAEFCLVQGVVQLLMAVSGLIIVRSLSKQDYALFAIANGMQTTGNLLADLGIGIGLQSIGGRVWNDRARFGGLLKTALALRRRFAVASLAVTLPLAAWMLWRNGASLDLTAGLCLTIAAGVVPLLGSVVFSASLQLHADYRRIQKLDLANSVLRLALLTAFACTRMNAMLAVLAGVVTNWTQLVFTRRWTRERADFTTMTNEEDRRELLRLSRRWLPNVLFFCFQGQITLMILTLVGNPVGIADMTALTRIATLFAVASSVFHNVLAPRFARCLNPERLPRLYLLLAGGTLLALMLLVLVAWRLPKPFLWLLGEQYSGLQRECGLVLAAACTTQWCAVMFGLNASKGWIRSQSIGFIPMILGVQILAAIHLDLSRFRDVLIFNLVTAAAPVPLYLVDAVFGMRSAQQTRRHIEHF